MVFIGFVWFVVAYNSSATNVSVESRISAVLKDTVIGYSFLSASIIGVVSVFGDFGPHNKLILWPLLYALITSFALRLFFLICSRHLVNQGYQQRQVLIIGGGRAAEKAIKQIMASRPQGYRLYGVLADTYNEGLPMGFYLGKQERFCEIARTGHVDEVMVALPLRMEEEILEIVNKCNQEGIRVRIVPDFFRIIRERAVVERMGDLPLIGIRPEPLSLLKRRVAKRTFDIFFSLTVLAILSPIFLIVALLIKLTSSGPVFFKQTRVGANNMKFDIYKFRSMTAQAKKESDTVWTTSDDSRVTGIGRFIRKYNIDELPQFWNVLIGNMSVVGPRPEREHFVEQFKNEIPHYKVRHLVKSGITGWAQVNGFRGDTSIEKRVVCDMDYIENWSFQFDLKIIWLTLFGRETNRNAY